MRFAENNRISHRQLYRQMILEFLAPFILCMYGARKLNGINALIGMAMALIPLGFYVIVLIRMTPVFENLKKSGAFVPGIRPGEQTARYIDKVLVRLTLGGAAYLTFVCLVPEFLNLRFNVPFYFGGTSLLIVVVVTMDFMSQVQAYMMSHQYENLLKKTNFKGFGGRA